MKFGITAFKAHLNAPTKNPSQTEIDWAAFKDWNKVNGVSKMPEFAGRYFLGQPYLWAHGEAADVFNGAKIPYIVPLQKADKDRQEATGSSGSQYGIDDAYALCTRLIACLDMQELSLVGKYVPVFLEVKKSTKLSETYWSAWCNEVANMMYGTVEEENVQGALVPIPKIYIPFLPCIYCEFTKNAAGKYVPDSQVQTCLMNTGRKSPGNWEKTRCRGFWARATDTPQYHAPEPALDWTKFETFEQPQSETTKVPVPVLFWRYMDKAAPGIDQFDKFTLDAAAPAAVNSLLKVEDWKLATVDAKGKDSVLTPTQFGIDRGASLQNNIAALAKLDMKLPELPSTYVQDELVNLHYFNLGVKTGNLKGKPAFVGRYYSGRPIDHRDLKSAEAAEISRQGIEIAMFFQGKAQYNQITNYLLTPNQGRMDALAAFSYAAEVIGQPPHTPIYFAIDADVDPAKGLSVGDIVMYFNHIQAGYDDYLKNRRIFTVSGVAQTPVPGAVYTNNGSAWTVIFGDISGGSGTVECWRSSGTAEPTASGALTKTAGTGDATLTFSETTPGEAVPYYIGVYSSWNVMDALYTQGLASFFWQAWPFTWGEKTSTHYPNLKIWPHANVWQVLLATRFSGGYWALPENKNIIEAAGGINVGMVTGTDGKEYLCFKDHTSSPATKPITGANAMAYWAGSGKTGWGVAWKNATAYKAPAFVIGTDGKDYLCNTDHTSSADTQPITGSKWDQYWAATGTMGVLGAAWANNKSYKSGTGPVDLNVAWGDTGGWKKWF